MVSDGDGEEDYYPGYIIDDLNYYDITSDEEYKQYLGGIDRYFFLF